MSPRERALMWLARREYSRAELARKLTPFAEADEISALLTQLEQENLLSNARYAESLAHSRRARQGSVRLKAELRDKGVEEHLISEVVSGAREGDLEAARAVWLKKFGEPPADAQSRAKQQRFLLGRGFPFDVVRRVVGEED